MARNTSFDRLRTDILDTLGPGIVTMNTVFHSQIRDAVQSINEQYLHARNAALATAKDNKYVMGLYLSFESKVETHTGLETGYIRWRYGRFSTNRSRHGARKPPITHRVPKPSRTQIHYNPNDFAQVPRWKNAPVWEQRLVLYAEKKVRPLREALQSHKEAQRLFLHAPSVPDIDPSFDDFIP